MIKKCNYLSKIVSALLLVASCMPVVAQEEASAPAAAEKDSVQQTHLHTVNGQILDAATKAPVLGARVHSSDRKYSALTDENGRFSIQLPVYLRHVSVQASDYSSIVYPLQGKTELEIELYPGSFKNNYLGFETLHSEATAEPQSLSSLTVDSELQSLLGGDIRVIAHSGTPGIGSSLFIRGFNSLNGGSQPLILLDGVLFDNQYDRTSIHEGYILNPLSGISVDDIESITVIKDGTSLYGSKGGNGILSIRTNRGRDVATKITINTMYGLNDRPKSIPMLDATQFRVYASDILSGVYSTEELSRLNFLRDEPTYYDYKAYHNDHNWNNDVYRDNSATQSYSVGVSGGDDVALYHLSMGYTNANSTLKANDFSRFSARFNSDIYLTSQLNFAFDLSYMQTDRDLRNDGFSENTNDLITAPSTLSLVKSPFLNPYIYSSTSGLLTSELSEADFLNIANPVSIIDNGIGKSSLNYWFLSVRPTYTFSPEWKLSGAFHFTLNNLFERYFRPEEGCPAIYVLAGRSRSYPYLLPEYNILRNQVQAQNSKQISLASDLNLNWKKRFDKHVVDVTGGLRFYSDAYKGEFGSGYNTSTDLDHNLNGSLMMRKTTGYDDSWRSFLWYAQAEYRLYDKYLLGLAASADASSRFGKDADLAFKAAGVNWTLYPSVNAAWIVSSEDFMKDATFVNLLKLRVGYGVSGNDNIPCSATSTYFSSLSYLKEATGKALENIGNTFLKPETMRKANLGLDVNLLSNRLSLSGDVYRNKTSDLLTLKTFHYISGMENYWTNAGEMESRGYEVAFNLKALNTKKLQWELGGNVAHYKNEITALPSGSYTTSIYGGEIQTAIGQPAGVFYGYKANGVFASTQEAQEANLKKRNATGVDYTAFAAGDIRFEDLYEDGIIDDNDKTVIGDPNPDFTGSFNTRLTYGKLSVNALFSFSYGNDVYNYVRSQTEGGNYLYNQSQAMLNRWVNEGQQTNMPRATYEDPMGNSRFSDRWIEDGSYLRFKSLTVAYDVPVNWIFLSGFTVWASAHNLWTYTKYLGVDPEFSINNSVLYQGIDSGLLSQGKSYFVGLKLNL